jgi:hypothetical protein
MTDWRTQTLSDLAPLPDVTMLTGPVGRTLVFLQAHAWHDPAEAVTRAALVLRWPADGTMPARCTRCGEAYPVTAGNWAAAGMEAGLCFACSVATGGRKAIEAPKRPRASQARKTLIGAARAKNGRGRAQAKTGEQ